MMFEGTGVVLADHPVRYGRTGLEGAAGITGDERMPVRQRFAIGDQTVGAGWWQPVDFRQRGGGQRNTVGHFTRTVGVITARAAVRIEEAAGDVGEFQLAGFIVAQFVQATAAATVAEGFPLHLGHLIEALDYPKRPGTRLRHGSNLAPIAS